MAEHPGILTTPEESTRDQLVAAMRVAERLLPRFTDIVRTSSGDPNLRVVIATGAPTASTDGATILMTLDPRMAYVDPLNPCTCDDDPDECTYHYTVGLLLHEGAHVSEGSTKKPDKEFYRRFTGRGTSLARVAGLTGYFEDCDMTDRDFKSALEVVNEYNWMTPGLANAFEDARINKAVGDKRSALGQQMRRIVDEFITEFATGTGFSETPVAYQVGATVEIGIEHGLNLTPMVHSDAARQCLNDPVVKSICEVDMDCTAHACAAAVILAEYARLKYGLFDQAPDNDSGTGRQTTTGRDTDREGSMRPAQRNREVQDLRGEYDLVRRANRNAEAEERGSREYLNARPDLGSLTRAPSGVVDKAAEELQRYDEEVDNLDAAMNQPGGGGYVLTGSEGDYQPIILRPDLQTDLGSKSGNLIGDGFTYLAGGEKVRTRYHGLESGAYTHLVQSKRLLADALGMNRRSANTPNLVRGRLHGSKLARVPTGNRRAFRRIDKPRKRSYAVLIGVDLSGSTGGTKERELRRMAYAQASLLASLGIRFAVAGHTGTKYRTDHSPGVRDADLATDKAQAEIRRAYGDGYVGLATHKLAKNFAEPWDESAKMAMAAFKAASANLDGITMQTYINMLCTQPATDRILLYYTDGQMPAEDHHNQLMILRRQLRRARAMAKLPDRRLHVVGIAVDCDSPKKYGLDTILVDSEQPDKAVRLVVEGLAERIARTIDK